MLYDWASSVLPTLHTTFVFAVYFTTAVLPENGTFYWAMMTGIAALATGLLAPILGHLADLKRSNKKGIDHRHPSRCTRHNGAMVCRA